ncbi:hypothetical protein [Fodinicola feengrottensis]|uniref:hypothetical protein n=1 Tax=Fodinicola feengrottensis TaxID=435914 RepID=UPI0013D601C9|nr:hypothetical protein [Fodinicola feengrottensis]
MPRAERGGEGVRRAERTLLRGVGVVVRVHQGVLGGHRAAGLFGDVVGQLREVGAGERRDVRERRTSGALQAGLRGVHLADERPRLAVLVAGVGVIPLPGLRQHTDFVEIDERH